MEIFNGAAFKTKHTVNRRDDIREVLLPINNPCGFPPARLPHVNEPKALLERFGVISDALPILDYRFYRRLRLVCVRKIRVIQNFDKLTTARRRAIPIV